MINKVKALMETDFHFPGQIGNVKRGKVRDIYTVIDQNDGEELLVMITTDRVSAFDVILPKGIPYKGQVLNQITTEFLNETSDICPNWKIATPDPMVIIGLKCKPFLIEMVIRGYLTGHAWREYKAGKRIICGVPMPDGMKENQKFPKPIITPTTKEDLGGHDADISKEEILALGLCSEQDYKLLEDYTYKLFERGTDMAEQVGLILVDTKYEFGKKDGDIYLIDEIHTPDSSRYFYAEGYRKNQKAGLPQKQLSKEFLRGWLMRNGFEGKPGQDIPEMTDQIISEVSERYIELYEGLTRDKFEKAKNQNVLGRIRKAVVDYLEM